MKTGKTTVDSAATMLASNLGQWAMLSMAMVAAGLLSVFFEGRDVNWDLLNYHFYNPWALLHGRLGYDLAPAQLQTYLNPLPDLPFYAMVSAHWPAKLIAFCMGLPGGIVAFFLAKLLWALFDGQSLPNRAFYTAASLVVGLTGASGVATFGTTMNEWPGGALLIASLWLLVSAINAKRDLAKYATVAGLLAGIACGMKLTAAPYAMGILVALPFVGGQAGIRLVAPLRFAVATLLGLFAAMGFWMWKLYVQFDNPLYPFFNNLFGSEWLERRGVGVRGYGPHSMLDWLRFPFKFLHPTAGYVSEMTMQDWRLPILYCVGILAAVTVAMRRVRGTQPAPDATQPAAAWTFLSIFFWVSLVLWAAVYSVYRYVLPIELISGALMIGYLRCFVPSTNLRFATVTMVVVVMAHMVYPDWTHMPYDGPYLQARIPPLAARPLVLMVNTAPTAFVAPFFPEDSRFLGVINNLNRPGRSNRMQAEIARIIKEHSGSFYSLAYPAGEKFEPLLLNAYALRKAPGDCQKVESNTWMTPIELCRLERAP